MCRGRLVELAPREVLFRNPIHYYTRALMAAVPYPDLDRRLDFTGAGAGTISDPAAWPEPFAVRYSRPCRLVAVGDGHFVLAAVDTDPRDLGRMSTS